MIDFAVPSIPMGHYSDSHKTKRRRCVKSESNSEEEEGRSNRHHNEVSRQAAGGIGSDDKVFQGRGELKRDLSERQVLSPISPPGVGGSQPSGPGITISVTATVTVAFPGGNTLTGSSLPSFADALPSTVVSTSTVSVSVQAATSPPTPVPAVPSALFSNATPSSTSQILPLAANPSSSQQLSSSTSSTSSLQTPTKTVTSVVPTSRGSESITASTINGSVVIFSFVPSSTSAESSPTPSSSTSISSQAPPIGGGAVPAAPTGTISNYTGKGSGSSNDNAKLPPILGGVFGAIAGVGLVLWVLLFLLRQRKRQLKGSNGDSGGNRPILRGAVDESTAQDRGAPASPQTTSKKQEMMSIFRSGSVSTLFGKSSKEPPTVQEFKRLTGRKVSPPGIRGPSVVPVVNTPSQQMSPGGDSAGGFSPASDDDGRSNPRWSQRHSQQGVRNIHSSINEDESEHHIMSPFVPSDPGEGGSRFPTPPPPRRLHGSITVADGVGRSLPSQDGSKTSRFTEDV